MSEQKSVLSPENLPTIAAVAFVLGLLAVSLNVANFVRTNKVAVAVASLEYRDLQDEKATDTDYKAKIAALEARLATMEAKAAAMAPTEEVAAVEP